VAAHVRRYGTVEGLPLAAHIRDLFKTAIEIAPEHHVRMQAAFQEHVDNAVSKTVNLPNTATAEDIAHIFSLAHDLGVKVSPSTAIRAGLIRFSPGMRRLYH